MFRLSSIILTGCLVLPALSGPARAAITVPSDGTDGAFSPAANTTVNLSQAITGTWNTAQSVANRGKGIYDASKWAVVFKYSSVNIPAGVTVNFTNHPSRAPVVWLVQGNVTIAGTLNLDGEVNPHDGGGAEPGPGGFRGGFGGGPGLLPSAGLGPGGGVIAGSGSYATAGYRAPANSVYGNVAVVPLIGGSGGGGSNGLDDGGAGGGAILIAATGTISLNGSINARGGGNNRAGSGGGIRLVADVINGIGNVRAQGGYYAGGDGRIRIEADTAAIGGEVNPAPSTLIPCGNTPVIWPADTAPKLVVTQVGGVAVPADPRGNFLLGSQDMSVTSTAPVTVRLQATNVPLDWLVDVRLIATTGELATASAIRTSGTAAASVWEATLTLPHGIAAIQARARKP